MVSLAVLSMGGAGFSYLEAETLTNYLRSELVETGAVDVAELERIQETLQKMGLQEIGCMSADCALEVGRLTGVSHALIGLFGKSDDSYSIDIQILTVDKRDTVRSISRTYAGDVDGFIIEIEKLAWEIVKREPPQGRFAEEQPEVSLVPSGVRESWVRNLRMKIRSLFDEYGLWVKNNAKVAVIGGAIVIVSAVGIIILLSGGQDSDIGMPPPLPEPPEIISQYSLIVGTY